MITETKSLSEYAKYNIGRGTYGRPEIRWPQSNLIIGNFCSIAGRVIIYLGGNHNVSWTTTYPLHTYFNTDIEGHPTTNGDVIISNDVWIGEGVTILSGSEIDDGAVIGAGAVVAGYIPKYTLAVGNPAKVKYLRFTIDVIIRLLKLQWWNWTDEKIKRNIYLLCGPMTLDILSLLEKED